MNGFLQHRGAKAEGVITSGTGQASYSDSVEFSGRTNLSLWGEFVATLRLERSFDKGATFIPCTGVGSDPVLFDTAASVVIDEPEEGVLYRVACTAYTSGQVNWRISR